MEHNKIIKLLNLMVLVILMISSVSAMKCYSNKEAYIKPLLSKIMKPKIQNYERVVCLLDNYTDGTFCSANIFLIANNTYVFKKVNEQYLIEKTIKYDLTIYNDGVVSFYYDINDLEPYEHYLINISCSNNETDSFIVFIRYKPSYTPKKLISARVNAGLIALIVIGVVAGIGLYKILR